MKWEERDGVTGGGANLKTRIKTNYSLILLISSGFTDKLCKATDVYQKTHTTLKAQVGGTRGDGVGVEYRDGKARKEKRDGAMKVGLGEAQTDT